MPYLNDVEYFARLACQRRAVTFQFIDSVAFGGRYDFGVADNTALLTASATNFYILVSLSYTVSIAQVTAGIRIELGSIGAAGASGAIQHQTLMAIGESRLLSHYQECEYVHYRINGNTAGSVNIAGIAFQVNHS